MRMEASLNTTTGNLTSILRAKHIHPFYAFEQRGGFMIISRWFIWCAVKDQILQELCGALVYFSLLLVSISGGFLHTELCKKNTRTKIYRLDYRMDEKNKISTIYAYEFLKSPFPHPFFLLTASRVQLQLLLLFFNNFCNSSHCHTWFNSFDIVFGCILFCIPYRTRFRFQTFIGHYNIRPNKNANLIK